MGPPRNTHHVREWSPGELLAMFRGFRMFPVFVTDVCSAVDLCAGVYDPEGLRPKHVSQILVVQNNIVGKLTLLTLRYVTECYHSNVNCLSPSNNVNDLSPGNNVNGLSPSNNVNGLSPSNNVNGLSPSNNVNGLSPNVTALTVCHLATTLTACYR